jgi:hypothetical protein
VLHYEPSHKDIGGVEYSSTHSLTSTLDGGERSASRTDRFTSRARAPSIHWVRGWIGPRTGLDAVVKRKIPSLRRESNSDHPIWYIKSDCSFSLNMASYKNNRNIANYVIAGDQIIVIVASARSLSDGTRSVVVSLCQSLFVFQRTRIQGSLLWLMVENIVENEKHTYSENLKSSRSLYN